ncbi:histone deacetylase family protein [Belnapia sp. T6]|uniref:Histone deacetylase family protein n=1 Tax=Belnapia mucosa TaxID=2804532 RepID=A0ABS1V9F5_9PROT|nr:histone deacetylase family protein [Belnapia mucosa]MBL6456968.1 histone deacetylase family protein [Belnapia mucosa]
MRAFFHPDQMRHQPRFFLQRSQLRPNFEVPARAEALLGALHRLGLAPETAAAPDRAAIEAVHAPDYIDFLEGAFAAWRALPNPGEEVVGNTHATADALSNGGRRPAGIIGQAGWYTADTSCPIGAGTWEASRAAAGVALAAAAEAAAGRAAYGLCRPPGHHAYAARAGGHCYLNNAAIAVAALRRAGAKRVAVLDIDSHHGNGTQGIFWEDASVLTVSVHGDPSEYYPFFTGYAEETGPAGTNRNLPLPAGTGDAGWLEAVATGIGAARDFGAEALVVSLGFDPSEHEPLGLLKVTADGFARAGAAIAGLGLPAAVIQEGGYNVEVMGSLLERFLTGWGGA